MRKTWIRNTLAALMAFAMVFGAVTALGGEQVAKADTAFTAVAAGNTTINKTVGAGPETLMVNATAFTGGTVTTSGTLTYVWSGGTANVATVDTSAMTNTNTLTIGNTPGNTTITCRVTDPNGNGATGSAKSIDVVWTIGVTYPAFTATLTPSAASITLGQTVTFTSGSISNTLATTGGYTWSTANKTSESTSVSAVYTPTVAGTFTATLDLKDVYGQTLQKQASVTVTNPTPSGVSISYNGGTVSGTTIDVPFNKSVALSGNATGANSYGWTATAGVTPANSTTQNQTFTAGAAAGSSTVTLTATNAAGSSSATTTIRVNAMTIDPVNMTLAVDEVKPIQVNYPEEGGYTLTPVAGTGSVTITADKKIKGATPGIAYVDVKSGNQTARCTVTVGKLEPQLYFTVPTTNLLKIATGKSATATVYTNSNGTLSWASNNTAVASVANTNAKTNSVYGVNASGTPTSISVTVMETATYASKTVTLPVTVFTSSDKLTVSPEVVSPAVGGTATFYITNTTNESADIVSSDTSVATVSQARLGGSGYITVTGVKKGTAYISVNAAGNYAYVAVDVGGTSGTPTISLSFNPNTYTLGYGGYTYMTIHVDNPKDNYVKITRDNLRGYVQDYNYSHPSQYVYWCTLDANNNATVLIRPQYSGTVSIMVDANGATRAYRTFTVTGYPTLPQTGPNYTAIYIVSGLCLAMVATAVTMNVRKKRKEQA